PRSSRRARNSRGLLRSPCGRRRRIGGRADAGRAATGLGRDLRTVRRPARCARDGVRVVMRRTKRYATELIPVSEIAHDGVRLAAGCRRAVLECATLAFGIKGELEQRAIVDGWAALLNSVAHPLQVIVRSTRVDP